MIWFYLVTIGALAKSCTSFLEKFHDILKLILKKFSKKYRISFKDKNLETNLE